MTEAEVWFEEAAKARAEADALQAECAALEKENEVDCRARQARSDALLAQYGATWGVRRSLMSAYLLGRSGTPISEEMIDRLMHGLETYDLMQLGGETASLKREVAALRKEVEASRPHKVVAMRRSD